MTAARTSRTAVLAVVLLGALATTVTITILTIALPAMARDLGATVADTAWVVLAPIVVSALVGPASGRAADVFGRKRLWLVGFTVMLLGVALSALAPSLQLLVAARVITGVGSALALPAGLAIATAEYSADERGIPIGWWTSVVALAPAGGVLIGGFAVQHLSWRWLFWGQLPLAASALVLGGLMFREHRTEQHTRFDLAGAVTGGVAIFSGLIALNRGGVWGWSSPAIIACIATSAVCVPWFVRIERRAAVPVLPVQLLRDPIIVWAIAVRGLLQGAYMGSFIILPALLMEVGNWSAAAVALGLVPRPLAMGLSGPVAGRLTTSRDPARIALFGSIALAVGVALLLLVRPDGAYAILLAALLCKGVGLGTAGTASGAIVAARAPEAELGTVSGFLGVTSSVSNSIGMALMLSVVTIAGGESSASAYHYAFAVGAVMSAAAVVCAAMLHRATRRAHSADSADSADSAEEVSPPRS